ncbi:MAG: hypothetical protein IRY87_35155, partial [Acetobacteraceae bacterium]|nr:hypothetical protein [Acetobacteraceae bacterium]
MSVPDHVTEATSSGPTLDALATVPRWVAWQTQDRKGKPSKVPHAPGGGLAKADTPATWGMRAQAEERAAALPRPYGTGGVGIMLGDHAGLALGGIDLDTCRDPATGTLEPWATEVVERFGSYAEVSPSGTGVKVFFSFDGAELPALRQAMRSEHGRQFKRKTDSDHPPAIELYLGNRYFAVTGQQLDGSPAELRCVSADTLLWLIQEAGPAFTDGGHKPEAAPEGAGGEAPARRPVGAGRDRSRSAAAFRLAAQEKRRGATYEQMKAALLADPETAAWTREKGLAVGERELRRIWDRATARHGRGGENRPTIRVTPGDVDGIVDQAEKALIAANLGIYQRGSFIVRPGLVQVTVSDERSTVGQRILEVGDYALMAAMTTAAGWERFDGRSEDWVATDAPMKVVKAYKERVGRWRLPVLGGIVNAPTLRADGSILAAPGYDEATGLLLDPRGVTFPAIPDRPSKEDADTALQVLRDLIATFPFVGGADRSVAYSA